MYKILANLPFPTNQVYYLPSCHSTNEIAQNLLPAGVKEGTVVITDAQTAGKGQAGNQWHSAPGQNLTFSLILQPTFLKPNEQFLLTVAVSLGIKDMLEDILPGEVKIKWPNDIYFRDRKIAGILIENTLRGSSFVVAVVGIGLNVNQVEFPAALKAVSVKQATGRHSDLNKLLNNLLVHIAHNYAMLKERNRENWRQRYHQSMLGFGEERQFRAAGEEFTGVIRGTDEFGRLLLERGKQTLRLQHKEVAMLG